MNIRAIQLALALPLALHSVAFADKPEDCTGQLRQIAQAESEKVACEIMDIAARIWKSKNVVPPRIYHFGKPAPMQRDVEARTIPKEDWDNYVMGNTDRRFELTPIRRGLYGTHFIDTNSFYSVEYTDLIEIHIKDECREPKHVTSVQEVYRDPKFLKWISSAKNLSMNLEKFQATCSGKFSYSSAYPGDCNNVIQRFLDEAEIKIIQDSVVKKSFYIRDRNCISTIRGRPLELLESFARYPSLLFTSCTNSYGRGGGHFLKTLLEDGVSSEVVDADSLKALQANARLFSDDSNRGLTHDVFLKKIDAFVNCKINDAKSDCRQKVKEAGLAPRSANIAP